MISMINDYKYYDFLMVWEGIMVVNYRIKMIINHGEP